MYLRKLHLSDFKSYSEADFTFSPKVNAIVGANGSGKTNLLDAVHYLSFTKSCFSAQDQQSVHFGSDSFAVYGDFEDPETDNRLKVGCTYRTGGRKTVKAGNKEYRRLSDHIGLLPVVMVAPADSDLINGSGELRRKFFNMMASQFDKEYLHSLISYNKLLQQRNALLRQTLDGHPADTGLLGVIDTQMTPIGTGLFEARRRLINGLLPVFRKYYGHLVADDEKVDIEYESGLLTVGYEQGLHDSLNDDMLGGHTHFGIHKDDFIFSLNGRPVRKYGSQGQQKSFLLALKLAQFDYAFDRIGKKPLLLLDDIFDKLDKARITELLRMVGRDHFGQVFLTDTDGERVHLILESHGISHDIIRV